MASKDLIFVQEIRDASDETFGDLLNALKLVKQ